MPREYKVKRKLQEQSGSYFVTLPKIWIDSLGLKQGDIMSIKFNGTVKVEPMKNKRERDAQRSQ